MPNRSLGFSLQFSASCEHCCPSLEGGTALGEKLGLEPQNVGAAKHLDGHPAHPTDKGKQLRESEDRSKVPSSLRQGLVKTPGLQTNNSVLLPHLTIRYLCHTPKKEIVRDFPGSPVVDSPPSKAGSVGSITSWGARIPHTSWPKHQNIKQK